MNRLNFREATLSFSLLDSSVAVYSSRLLLQEQNLSFKRRYHILKGYVASGSKQEVTKMFPYVRMAEIHGCVSINLK